MGKVNSNITGQVWKNKNHFPDSGRPRNLDLMRTRAVSNVWECRDFHIYIESLNIIKVIQSSTNVSQKLLQLVLMLLSN